MAITFIPVNTGQDAATNSSPVQNVAAQEPLNPATTVSQPAQKISKITFTPATSKTTPQEEIPDAFKEGGFFESNAPMPGTIIPQHFYWQVAKTNLLGDKPVNWQETWNLANTPVIKLPEARKDIPAIGGPLMINVPLMNAVWNGAVKPFTEGIESPLGVATLGAGTALRAAKTAYPIAKAALMGMEGIFAGVMGYNAINAIGETKKVFNDPNSTFQDKATALSSAVANSLASLTGVLGFAFDALPKSKAAKVSDAIKGKTPSEAAQTLRDVAVSTEDETAAKALQNAAIELDKYGNPELAIPRDEGNFISSDRFGNTVVSELTRDIGDGGLNKDLVNVAEIGKVEKPKPVIQPTEKLISEPVVSPPETVAEQPSTATKSQSPISIKNETIDAELAKMGEPPAEHGESLSFERARSNAENTIAENPRAGSTLVKELLDKTRPITGDEDALLLHELNTRRIARDAADSAFLEAVKTGDERLIGEARAKKDIAARDFKDAASVDTAVGTMNAQGLALRRMMMNEDYSIAGMERRWTSANDGVPLTDEQSVKLSELSKNIAEKQKVFDEYRAKQNGLTEEQSVAVKQPNKVSAYLSDRAAEARQRIIQRMKEGRLMAGIDPADFRDYAIIGADYIARGVTKFADWSTEMVKEFGDRVRPHLQAIYDQAINERKDAQRLQSYKTRTQKSILAQQEKTRIFESGQVPPKPERRPIPLDSEALKLKAALNEAKIEADLAEESLRLKNRTPQERIADSFAEWVRFGALSWPTVLGKLTGAAAIRTITTPIEQIAGYGISKVLPKLAERAPRHGVTDISTAIGAEKAALQEMITSGVQGAIDYLKNKSPQREILLDKRHLPPGPLEYVGKVHGALKYPTKANEYARAEYLRKAYAERNGIDLNAPDAQFNLMKQAQKDAEASIFLQDNTIVSGINRTLNYWSRPNAKTGKVSPVGLFLSTLVKTEIPIMKVPTNVVAEASQIIGGSLVGPAKAAWAYAKGIEKLQPEEADAIMRLLKKGMFGAAMLAIGYFKRDNIGGFFEKGEKRKPGEVKAGDVRIGDTDIPYTYLHNPYISALHFGSTLGKTAIELYEKEKNKGSLPAWSKSHAAGLIAASMGLVEETPFVRETSTIEKYIDPRQRETALGRKATSIIIPGAIQWVAAQMDKPTPFSMSEQPLARKPKTFLQSLQKGIPGLRQNVPVKPVVPLR